MILKPEGDLVIRTSGKALRLFRAGSKGAHRITLDLSGVGSIDSCGVQLLVHLARSSERQSVPFSISRTSAAVSQALQEIGLSSMLQSGGPV